MPVHTFEAPAGRPDRLCQCYGGPQKRDGSPIRAKAEGLQYERLHLFCCSADLEVRFCQVRMIAHGDDEMTHMTFPAFCKRVCVAAFVVSTIVGAGSIGQTSSAQTPRADTSAPVLKVDPAWPKPLPNKWSVGPVSGITIDAREHIWIVQRGETVRQSGGVPAPPVIEFDFQGNVVQTWGGPGDGYEWPEQVHGITVDYKDRVWISGNGENDAQILAFTREGKFLRQIGRSGRIGGSNDTQNLGHATQMRIDPQTNEVYVSDGENSRNRRVIVFDADTGAYKRHWGAYGEKPDDASWTAKVDPKGPPPKQFGTAVHCVRIARDGLIYVCDRSNSRFQIFRRDGTFVKELFIARGGPQSVWDIDFTPDQRFMYVADGGNQKVWVVRRDDLEIVGSFGGPGKDPGQFATSLHDIVVDARGNLYTGEAATGGRVQKFAVQ
jgi:DNA-binding beta-propeller fold protein YncE